MDKDSIIALQKIDCNCNDCLFMTRDMTKMPQKGVPCPINYGYCEKFAKSVSFIPSHCSIENQKCFVHRKDGKSKLHELYDKAAKQYIYFSKFIYKDDYPKNILELLDNSYRRKMILKKQIVKSYD